MAQRITYNDWDDVLKGEFSKPYYIQLQNFLDAEYKTYKINPRKNYIYKALELTPFKEVKVAIVGQDPYPGENLDVATGLAFSTPKWMNDPKRRLPSATNIQDLLKKDLKDSYDPVSHGCLESWAKQGVLLLNSILTVRQGDILSHENKGWEMFTDAIIKELSNKKQAMVFILWGNIAIEKQRYINSKHLVLTAPHPAAVKYDKDKKEFFEKTPFSETNTWLKNRGLTAINWQLPAK